ELDQLLAGHLRPPSNVPSPSDINSDAPLQPMPSIDHDQDLKAAFLGSLLADLASIGLDIDSIRLRGGAVADSAEFVGRRVRQTCTGPVGTADKDCASP